MYKVLNFQEINITRPGGAAMTEKILIFGKSTWPHTVKAREAYTQKGQDVEYYDVINDADKLERMLKYSDGRRRVPVIVEQGKVTIGFKGKTWGV